MRISKISRIGSVSRYPVLVILPAFISGIWIQQCLHQVDPGYWMGLTLICCLTAVILHVRRSIKNSMSAGRTFFILAAFLLLGAALAGIQDVRNYRSWYGHYIPEAEAIRVKITDMPVIKAKTIWIPIKAEGICVSGKWLRVTGNISLYVYRKGLTVPYATGQTLIIPNKLVRVKSSGNPFAFDMAMVSERKGIFHQSFLPADQIYTLKDGPVAADPIRTLRAALQAAIDQNVKDSTTRALIAATLLNERNAMDQDLMTAYANTGIIHIVAISGMHIALLASIVLALLRIIPSKKLKGIQYSIAVIMVWIYIALTGFPPSAVRAALMFTIFAIGLVLGRPGNAINTWAAAGLLLLCYNPYWLYDVGVQLSFLAVLSILLFYAPVKRWIAPRYKILQWLWDVIAVSIAAQILVFPLVIYYFNQFPLLGLAANIPAALYSLILMLGAILLFVLQACGFTCLWLGNLLTFFTKVFNTIIFYLSDKTPQGMRNLYIDGMEYGIMMAIILFLCLFCMRRKAGYLLAGLAAGILLMTDLLIKDIAGLQQEKLVVYSTGKTSQADWFCGERVTHLFPADQKQEKYILRPALLGYGIHQETTDTTTGSRFIKMHDARIVFLKNSRIRTASVFPADVLVVSDQSVFNPALWMETFHPAQIILDGSLPRWKAIRWKEELRAAGMKVHWVQEDGAWICPSS